MDPDLFLFTIWSPLTRIIYVIILISTLHPFWRSCRNCDLVESLVWFISRFFLMVGKYYLFTFRLKLFWIYVDASYHHFSCNDLYYGYHLSRSSFTSSCTYLFRHFE